MTTHPNPALATASRLHRQGMIDGSEMAVLVVLGNWLARLKRARRLPSDGDLWGAITGGRSKNPVRKWRSPITVRGRRTPAQSASWHVVQLRNTFTRRNQLGRLDRLMQLAAGDYLPVSERELFEVKAGIELAAEHLARQAQKTEARRVAGIAQKISDQPGL